MDSRQTAARLTGRGRSVADAAEWATLPVMIGLRSCLPPRQTVLQTCRNSAEKLRPKASRKGSTALGESELEALDRPRRPRLVKSGVILWASLLDDSSTEKGLAWNNVSCEVDDAGSMRLGAASGSALKIINLKRCRLDSVCGSLHAVLEENKQVEYVIPDKFKNEAHLAQPVLNLPPERKDEKLASAVFLKFCNDSDKGDWVDALLGQGVVAGPGIQHQAERYKHAQLMAARTPIKSTIRKEANAPRGSEQRLSVDPTLFENSLGPTLHSAQRRSVMFDYNGSAPISRRSLNLLPFDSTERDIIQSPLGSPLPRRTHSGDAVASAVANLTRGRCTKRGRIKSNRFGCAS